MGAAISTPLAVSVAIPIVGGVLISEATRDNMTWYRRDVLKPSWSPPGWLFGPVWVVLYGLMGTASYMIYEMTTTYPELGNRALLLYAAQLALNFLWPLVFFGGKKLGTSVAVNFALLITSAATCGAFYKVLPEAGQLLLPYLAWLVFANILNWKVWRLNPPGVEDIQEAARRDERARLEEKGTHGYGPLGPESDTNPPPAGATASMAPVPSFAAMRRTPQQRHFVTRLAPQRAVRPRPTTRMPAVPRAAMAGTAATHARMF